MASVPVRGNKIIMAPISLVVVQPFELLTSESSDFYTTTAWIYSNKYNSGSQWL